MSLSEKIPLWAVEERIALIESVKEITLAIISRSSPIGDKVEFSKQSAEIYYTIYNEIAKNLKHE